MMTDEEFFNRYCKKLNTQQCEAVRTVSGPVLLLAVPGSGKTTVLVHRVGYMLICKNISPDNLLVLTYTVSATRDMKERFASIFGEELASRVEFRTINGICSKVITRYGKKIGKPPFSLQSDEKELTKILTGILVDALDEYPTESDIKAVKTLITYCKNMMLPDDRIEAIGKRENIPLLKIFTDYQKALRDRKIMDYDDQLTYAYRLLVADKDLLEEYRACYRYICVDEAQDTSKIQHEIIKLLAGQDGNLFMVGDEDQSIYGFRAAYPEALLGFEKDHQGAKVLVMDRNYRSNAEIVSVADSFIQRNKERHKKHMEATRPSASKVKLIDIKSRPGQYGYLLKVAEKCETETAVLYRDNENVLPLIDRLERAKIPFRIKSMDMAFFTHRVVLDVTSFFRLALNPYDTDLFMKLYFKLQTFLKKDQAERMCLLSSMNNTTVADAAEEIPGLNGKVLGNCRSLSTHLKNMLNESPSKAIYRMEEALGYGEYLDRNSIDRNKLYILKQLAENEKTLTGFLDRLEYLKDMLANMEPYYSCKFILSTIHSSKGLEYSRVYLMDVFDGAFPSCEALGGYGRKASAEERKMFEEERRLYYVAITRAKDELSVFKIANKKSLFIDEMGILPKGGSSDSDYIPFDSEGVFGTSRKKKQSQTVMGNYTIPGSQQKKASAGNGTEIKLGARVRHKKYGEGIIVSADVDGNGSKESFTVEFDNGDTKDFSPVAFVAAMKYVE